MYLGGAQRRGLLAPADGARVRVLLPVSWKNETPPEKQTYTLEY